MKKEIVFIQSVIIFLVVLGVIFGIEFTRKESVTTIEIISATRVDVTDISDEAEENSLDNEFADIMLCC